MRETLGTRTSSIITQESVDDAYCQGVSFCVENSDALAQAIALVLVQEFALAKAIVTGTSADDDDVALDSDDINDIVECRLHPTDVHHRDGLLFQLIMWLAAHLDLEDGDLVALPHSQASAKGQDSIVVHRAVGAVAALSICEDKATVNPRSTVRDDVWPVIREYEKGARRDELRSNIIATLGTGGVPVDEAVRLVRGISWAGKRRYRVRVTLQTPRKEALFKGFDKLVVGPRTKRRGETLLVPDLRAWMTKLAAMVETHLRTYDKEG